MGDPVTAVVSLTPLQVYLFGMLLGLAIGLALGALGQVVQGVRDGRAIDPVGGAVHDRGDADRER